jgi:hypothetical protein
MEELLDESRIVTSPGRYPTQIVLRQLKERSFATHMKVIPPDADPYVILGRYFTRLEDAREDFMRRCHELAALEGRSEDA